MANGAIAELGQEEEEAEVPAEQSAGVSPLDVDFLVFALPLAFVLDMLSWLFMGLDAGVLAAAVNIVLGGLLILWMVARGKRLDQAKAEYRQAVQMARMGRKGFAARRQATIARIGGKRTSRRLLKRALIMYVGNSIPLVNFIPFWLTGVILMLREK